MTAINARSAVEQNITHSRNDAVTINFSDHRSCIHEGGRSISDGGGQVGAWKIIANNVVASRAKHAAPTQFNMCK